MKGQRRRFGKKTVLCISGLGGCGKSTVAKRIAQKYGLTYFSGGNALKALALEAGYKFMERGWWESNEGLKFLKKRARDFTFDRKVDQKLLEQAKQGDVVLDSWTMPWLLRTGFKIWLEASLEERARRIAHRDEIGTEEALKVLKEKDARTRTIYRKLYGFNLGADFSPFDLILDVNRLTQKEVFQTLCLVIDNMVCRPES